MLRSQLIGIWNHKNRLRNRGKHSSELRLTFRFSNLASSVTGAENNSFFFPRRACQNRSIISSHIRRGRRVRTSCTTLGRKIFGIFYPLSLITCTLTQPISNIICFWAFPSSLWTSYAHAPLPHRGLVLRAEQQAGQSLECQPANCDAQKMPT